MFGMKTVKNIWISEVCHFLEQKKTSKNNFSDGEKIF